MLDAINKKILRDLMQDGRKKFCDIAKEASLSTDAICKRFKGLEKSGIPLLLVFSNMSNSDCSTTEG